MIIKPANRTNSVSEYYFSKKLQEIDLMNRQGAEVINLGIGAPDRMPPEEAILTLIKEAQHPGNHAYQSYKGIKELREGFATWYKKYYRVDLNPDTEIQPLAGSKEGILLLSLAFLNKGDQVLVPNPGYPTYSSASLLAEAGIVLYDLKEETGWMPDFEQLENRDLSRVKMMWTNYPNMPTGAKATMALYERLVEFGLKHRILICNDNPYSFILNDEQLSILSIDGAKTCCVELNSLSKAHHMENRDDCRRCRCHFPGVESEKQYGFGYVQTAPIGSCESFIPKRRLVCTIECRIPGKTEIGRRNFRSVGCEIR